MTKVFKLPDLGEGVHEGQIVRVFVREGESVREDQPLMEVETDKASVEIPSPFTGVVEKVHVSAGQLVHVGDVMVTFGAPGASASNSGGGSATSVAEGTHQQFARPTHPPTPSLRGRGSMTTAGTVDEGAPSTTATSLASPPPHRRKPASPAVRKLARNFDLDIESIAGSGPGGRITISDVEQASKRNAPGNGFTRHQADVHSPPLMPRETASEGSITVARPPVPQFKSPARQIIEGAPGNDTWGSIVRSPLSRIRKTIADAMSHSVRTIPHVTDTGDADITELDHLRRGYASPDEQRKLTMLPFVIRAVALALARHPIFNASYDEERNEIIYHEYISIAVGVHTERGLVAPVLREVDRMSIAAVADELNVLAENARSARFQVNDTRGGTFTVSNAGAVGGSRYSTPIINHPQVAVLAIGRSKWMPWIVQPPTIEARLVMPLSLSFDHRIIDGGTSIPFLQDIISLLENPARLVL
jgi:pyruvate dehydrogenase E2 component (dihydrolipoamide acetyltransferase)